MSPEQAARTLGCRTGASAREVRAAFRRTVREARPDTGHVDGSWLVDVKAARDLLLFSAGPDRRRRERGLARTGAAYLPLRRSTWQPPDPPRHEVDLHL